MEQYPLLEDYNIIHKYVLTKYFGNDLFPNELVNDLLHFML